MAMKRFAAPSLGAIAAAAALLLPGAAHALFEDGDARRAILDLRAQVDQLHKADQGAIAEIQQVRSILMELQGQIGVLRNEVASLRGQNEELQQNLRRAESRLQAFEAQPAQGGDAASAAAQPAEQQAFEAALEHLRKGQYQGARDAFRQFLAQYPDSSYAPSAQFWLGNSLYATREYYRAIETFNAMLKQAPQHAQAPDAALAIAKSQIELKNVAGARQTLQNLVKVYPNSSAAKEARESLTRLK